MKLVPVFLICCFALPLTGFAADFSITVENIKSTKGSLVVALYSPETSSAFPAHPEKALKEKIVPIEGERQTIVFENLSDGNYAVSVVHDENGNDRMDHNFLGLPKEGFGFSNNPSLWKGVPGFDVVSVPVSASNQKIIIKLNY